MKLTNLIIDFVKNNTVIDIKRIDEIDKQIFNLGFLNMSIVPNTIELALLNNIVESEIRYEVIYQNTGSIEHDDYLICDYLLYDVKLTTFQLRQILRQIRKAFGKFSTRLFSDIKILKTFNTNLSERSKRFLSLEEKRFTAREDKERRKEQRELKKFYKHYEEKKI